MNYVESMKNSMSKALLKFNTDMNTLTTDAELKVKLNKLILHVFSDILSELEIKVDEETRTEEN